MSAAHKTMKKIRRRKKTDKLLRQMGVFEIVLPCFQGSFVCDIAPMTVQAIKQEKVSTALKSWFADNEGEVFDDDMLFQFIEEDTEEQLDSDTKELIKKHVIVRNETVSLKRLSMLTIMKGKHYPSELSTFVQNMYSQKPEGAEGEMVGEQDSDDALTFHQWVVCHSMIDPKVLPLQQVTDFLKGQPIAKQWFDYRDLERLKQIRKDLEQQDKAGQLEKPLSEWDTESVRNYSVFADELWLTYDPVNPERKADIWWVEDFVSDTDLVTISGAAFNGPNTEEQGDLTPFSEER